MEKVLQGRAGMIRRIAITGPESTGKTQLAQELAAYYKTIWVPEFARDYLVRINRPYSYDDILHIAQQQFGSNQMANANANRFVFCDTELIVTKIWCEVKYGKCHEWIVEHIPKQNFGLYLIPDIDLPWQPDPQREHPQMREYLKELYIKSLDRYKLTFALISGEGNERLQNAINVIERFLSKDE